MRNLSNLAILRYRALWWHQQLQADTPAWPMRERYLNDGEFVYRVGDPPDSFYIILNGTIVLAPPQTEQNGTERTAGQGTIFSAAEAMGGPNPSAMAHARGQAAVQIMSSAEVLSAVSTNQPNSQPGVGPPAQNPARQPTPAPFQPQITDQRVNGHAPNAKPVALKTSEMGMTMAKQLVRISAVKPEVARQLQSDPMTIERFPFVVGRQSSRSSDAMSPPVTLTIPDTQPFQMSRRHFMIDQDEDGIIVRDCGSHNGTIVNGVLLGGNSIGFRAVLTPGENEIIAGTLISKFQFTCWI